MSEKKQVRRRAKKGSVRGGRKGRRKEGKGSDILVRILLMICTLYSVKYFSLL